MATFGKIGEFSVYQGDWDEYIERLEFYFVANKITDKDVQKSILLTVCGAKTYSLIRNLVAPKKPGDEAYADLKTKIENHLRPKPLVIAERFKFHQRKQNDGETVSQFLANLRKLTEQCQFNAFLDEALRDRLVCGLASRQIQKKLLSEDELTLDRALKIAVSMELAEREANKFTFKAATSSTSEVHRMATECFRCGKNNHTSDNCFHKNSKCHKCKCVGHLSKKCTKDKFGRNQRSESTERYKPKVLKGRGAAWETGKMKKKQSKVKFLEDCQDDDNEAQEWPIFTVNSKDSKEIKIKIDINNVTCTMELDTGVSMSIISEKTFRETLGISLPLKPTSIILKTYTGVIVPLIGEIEVQVKYGSQEAMLPLIVVKGDGPSLLGRNWLTVLKLDWQNLHFNKTVNVASADELFNKYASVFSGKLGTVKGVKAKLQVKENSEHKFFKPRPVPFALRDKIADELHRLEREGIIEKVQFSEWAAPIVPVLKPDNSVRICGDYKVTINPALNVPEYPLPTSEEIFSRLNGGQKFSKLDMSHAYQQVLLDEESRKYVTINTHLGLYRYTRLPFGVAAAPAIYQQMMDTILEGLDGVGCIIDDIMVTGRTDQEHWSNLELTLQRLQEHGMQLKRSKCCLMQEEVEYFAFVVNKDGIQPSRKKVEAILEIPEPRDVKELQSWLGLVNYYRKFIPDLSTIVQPLTELLCKTTEWKWNDSCKHAFSRVQALLVSSEILAHYDPDKPIELAVDASPFGLGAVISHQFGGVDRPIAYASRTLSATERNYSQIEKESLAIIFGIHKFHQYLYGRQFTLLTDNKPLSLILGPKKGIPVLAASRIQRWAVQLASYQFDIKYRSTDQNANADALSRLPLNECADISERDKIST